MHGQYLIDSSRRTATNETRSPDTIIVSIRLGGSNPKAAIAADLVKRNK